MSHTPGSFETSSDFDNALYEAIFVRVRDKYAANSRSVLPGSGGSADAWTEFAGGWNAVKVRFEGCTDYHITFTDLVNKTGVNPPPSERFVQDHELFVFFFAGFAAVESYYYALFSLGGLLSPANFPMATEPNLKSITPKSTKAKYVQHYNGEDITTKLNTLLSSAEYDAWSIVRNTLAHRTAPGRLVYTGGPNGDTAKWTIGVEIDANTTQIRRHWLLQTLHSLMVDTKTFVDKYVV